MADFSEILVNTTAQRIETIANMDINNGVIDENSNDGSLPTSKAVYEAIKNIEVSGGGGTVDQTYIPQSENAQSGIAVAEATQLLSNALKGSKSGQVISVDDMSPLERNLDVKIECPPTFANGKNLIYFEELMKESYTQNGLTFTRQADGSYLVNGTFSNEAFADGELALFCLNTNEINFKANTYYTASGFEELFEENWFVDVYSAELGTFVDEFNYYKPQHSFEEECKTNGEFRCSITNNKVFNNVRFAPQIELGEVATEFENPLIETDLTKIEVSRYGKNLFDGTLTENLSLSGTGNNRTVISTTAPTSKIIKVKPNTTYSFSGDFTVVKDKILRVAAFNEYPIINSVSTLFKFDNKPFSITTSANTNYLFLWFTIPSYREGISVQVEEGATATEYEPCSVQTATANFDGTVEGLTSIAPNMTLLTDTVGATINLEYNRDINIAFAKLEQAILNNA